MASDRRGTAGQAPRGLKRNTKVDRSDLPTTGETQAGKTQTHQGQTDGLGHGSEGVIGVLDADCPVVNIRGGVPDVCVKTGLYAIEVLGNLRPTRETAPASPAPGYLGQVVDVGNQAADRGNSIILRRTAKQQR